MPLRADKGYTYKVHGKEITLYSIATLAQRLSKVLKEPRTTQTIRKWEAKKVIPPAKFRVHGKRLYTEEQINIICSIAKEEKLVQGVPIASSKFSQRVWAELTEYNTKL